MPNPAKIPVKALPKVMESISARMPNQPNPRLGKFIASVVQDPAKLEAFRANPEGALKGARISAAGINLDLLRQVVDSIVVKITGPGDVASTVTSKETSEQQERNFDNGSSWYWNKDGYNVMYDKGHSSSKSTEEMIATDKKFSGAGIRRPDLEVINQQLGKLFFPSQPLVTPQLIDQIKKTKLGG